MAQTPAWWDITIELVVEMTLRPGIQLMAHAVVALQTCRALEVMVSSTALPNSIGRGYKAVQQGTGIGNWLLSLPVALRLKG